MITLVTLLSVKYNSLKKHTRIRILEISVAPLIIKLQENVRLLYFKEIPCRCRKTHVPTEGKIFATLIISNSLMNDKNKC